MAFYSPKILRVFVAFILLIHNAAYAPPTQNPCDNILNLIFGEKNTSLPPSSESRGSQEPNETNSGHNQTEREPDPALLVEQLVRTLMGSSPGLRALFSDLSDGGRRAIHPTEPRGTSITFQVGAHQLPGVRHFGRNPRYSLALMRQYHLMPRLADPLEIIRGQARTRYYFSAPFNFGGGRTAVFAIVESRGQRYFRVFYRSNSHGVFRIMPAVTNIDRPHASKPELENAINVPWEVQSHLMNEVQRRGVREIPENIRSALFRESTYYSDSLELRDAYRNGPDFFDNYFRAVHLFNFNKKTRMIPLKDAPPIPHPSELHIPRTGSRPNYTRAIGTFPTRTSLDGNVTAEVYASNDASLHYLIYRPQDGRIYIAAVYSANSRINRYGTPSEVIDASSLTHPRWEYETQTPEEYPRTHHPEYNNYVDNWAYVRQIPVVQEYYAARGESVPP